MVHPNTSNRAASSLRHHLVERGAWIELLRRAVHMCDPRGFVEFVADRNGRQEFLKAIEHIMSILPNLHPMLGLGPIQLGKKPHLL